MARHNDLKPKKMRVEKHPKGWGQELWIVNNEKYCGKILEFKKGATMSDHYHLVKEETWYVLEGKLALYRYDLSNADRVKIILKKGDVVHIPPGAPHQLQALARSTIIEVSTPHDERDSYRIGKGDGQKKR